MEIENTVVEQEIDLILASENHCFSDLVRLLERDPKDWLIGGDFRQVDFAGSDLRGFNFNGCDLRGASWEGAKFDETTLVEDALLGRSLVRFDKNDFLDVIEVSQRLKTWAERFYAFTLLVDVYGETEQIVEQCRRFVMSESTKYGRLCAGVYLAASYERNPPIMQYCKRMADNGNSPTNWGRNTKVSRYANEFLSYLARIERAQRFPTEATPVSISSVLHFALNPED